jgi:hypothetical protein
MWKFDKSDWKALAQAGLAMGAIALFAYATFLQVIAG